MVKFLPGIFADLNNQVLKMLEALESLKFEEADVRAFQSKAKDQLFILHERIQNMLDGGDLEIEELISHNLLAYTPLFETYQSIEQFRFQPLYRYGQAERYFNALTKRIYKEIRCSLSCPLIATISNSDDYFWAFPYHGVIAVPLGEEKNLLNLPDLYHEIAHFIYWLYWKEFYNRFSKALDKHFQSEIDKAELEQTAPKKLVPFLKDVWQKWKEYWIEEFTCDLIGTFLTGTAYAWTNLKLTSLSGGRNQIYEWSSTHPADESRMRIIFMMLSYVHSSDAIAEVKETWEDFQNSVPSPKHDYYSYYSKVYPEHLLLELTQIVYDVSNAIGLCPYSQQIKDSERPISKILNEAWEKNRNEPDEFTFWEAQTIREIGSQLGIGG